LISRCVRQCLWILTYLNLQLALVDHLLGLPLRAALVSSS
jgi:hypothetical protein